MARGALLCTQARSLAEDGLIVIAGKIFEEVLKEDPTESEALFGIGVLLYQQDSRNAVTWIQRAVRVDPTIAARWTQLARALSKRSDFAGGANALRRALLLDPGGRDAWMCLGNLEAGCANLAKAALAFRRAAQLAPDQSEAHLRLPGSNAALSPVARAKITEYPAKNTASGVHRGVHPVLTRRVIGN